MRLVSPKECNLFESSMLSSSSNTCEFINATSFLQVNTDALYIVTLNLYETKVPLFNEEILADALYRWLRKFQVILPAFGPEWNIIYVS